MTDSAYIYDPRVIWQADRYEIHTGDGTWTIHPDEAGRWTPYDPEGLMWREQFGRDHQDHVIEALIGEPLPLDDEQIRLLTHAAAMGGWLSADYVTGAPQTDPFSGEQIPSFHAEALVLAAEVLSAADLWELVETPDPAHRLIYQLTDLGAAKAAELAG